MYAATHAGVQLVGWVQWVQCCGARRCLPELERRVTDRSPLPTRVLALVQKKKKKKDKDA